MKDIIGGKKKNAIEKSISENPNALKEAAYDNDTPGGKNDVITTNDPSAGEAGFFDTVISFAKSNPVATIAILGVGAYALIPPVRNAVNGMIGLNSRGSSSHQAPSLKGLPGKKKLPSRKRKTAVKTVYFK